MTIILENLSKLRKTYLKKLRASLSKSEVKQIAKDLKRLNIMPKGKVKHSIRVSDRLVDLDVNKDVILGALFHDYIERGGDVDDLSISEDTKDIVRFLSSFDDTFASSGNEPLEHLIHIFGRIDNQELKNQLVMIKLSDRIDNLNRRGKSVSKGYLKKSIALLKFLMSNYTGSVDLGKLLITLNRKLHKRLMKRVRITEDVYLYLEDRVQFKKIVDKYKPSEISVNYLLRNVPNKGTYLGRMAKYMFVDNEGLDDISKAIRYLKKDSIRKQINIFDYNNLRDFLSAAGQIDMSQKFNKIIHKLPLKLKNALREMPDDDKGYFINYFVDLDDEQRSYVLKKAASFDDDVEDFISFVRNLPNAEKNFNKWVELLDNSGGFIIYNSSPYVLARFNSQEEIEDISCQIGWCIRKPDDLNIYSNGGASTFFVLVNAVAARQNERFVGFFSSDGHIDDGYDIRDEEVDASYIYRTLDEMGVDIAKYDNIGVEGFQNEFEELEREISYGVVLSPKQIKELLWLIYYRDISIEAIEDFLKKYRNKSGKAFDRQIKDLEDIKNSDDEGYLEYSFYLSSIRDMKVRNVFELFETFFGINPDSVDINERELMNDFDNLIKSGNKAKFTGLGQQKLDLNMRKYIKGLLEDLSNNF